MQKRLPLWIDPRTLSPGRAIEGLVSVGECDQLSGLVLRGDVDITAAFDVLAGDAGRVRLSGRISGTLSLHCQRCLDEMDWSFDREVAVELVESDAEAARVQEDVEPCLLQDGRLMVRELVAEEVLLAMPMAPRHEECDPARRDTE